MWGRRAEESQISSALRLGRDVEKLQKRASGTGLSLVCPGNNEKSLGERQSHWFCNAKCVCQ